MNNYAAGFASKCIERGVDPVGMMKLAQIPFDPGLMSAFQDMGAQAALKAKSDLIRSNPQYELADLRESRRKAGMDDSEWPALRQLLLWNQGENTSKGLMSGKPFSNTAFFGRTNMPERVVVNIGGYGEGEGGAAFGAFERPFSVAINPIVGAKGRVGPTEGIDQSQVLSFQHSQGKGAQRAIDLFRAAGVPTVVVGHSYGGDTAAHLAKRNPDVRFHAIDPVGRLDPVEPKDRPENLTTYKPSEPHKWDTADYVAWMGRRYDPDKKTVKYNGTHVAGTSDLARAILSGSGSRE